MFLLRKNKRINQKEKAEKDIPKVDLTADAIYNTQDIMKILPHRFPFLLVDKIMSITPTSIIGIKNVTFNEYWFQGHFPDEPIMPGVLLVEAMAQTGGVLCLKLYPDPENYQTYFLKMTDVKFKHKVVPGDVCVFKLDLVEPVRRGMCHMLGRTYVNGKLVAEADMLARLVKVRGFNVTKTEEQIV